MHQTQKKKKQIMLALMAVLFLASGIWYYRIRFLGTKTEDAVFATEQNGDAEDSQTGTPSVTASAREREQEEQLQTQPQEVPQPMRYLHVFVCGCITEAGVYRLPEGSRLYEAIRMAGGFTERADETYHNLARLVSDGERVYVPSKEETKEFGIREKLLDHSEAAGSGKGVEEMQAASVVNLNTATKEALMGLPGIGEAKANDILEYRAKVGRFTAIEEIMNISGIGTSMFERIKGQIAIE